MGNSVKDDAFDELSKMTIKISAKLNQNGDAQQDFGRDLAQRRHVRYNSELGFIDKTSANSSS